MPIEYANLVSEFVAENPGPGGNLDTFITASPLDYDDELPVTNILGTVIAQDPTQPWEEASRSLRQSHRAQVAGLCSTVSAKLSGWPWRSLLRAKI